MYITSLQYFILICLCSPTLRMLSKEERKDMKSQMLELAKTDNFDNAIFEEEKTNLTRIEHLKVDYEVTESHIQSQRSTCEEHISIDFYFIFLYHIMLRKVSRESILATTALFFGKVSAFPVNCTSSTDRSIETGLRKERDISTSSEFIRDRGDCEKDWSQFEEKCYQAFQEIMNYKTANAHCKSVESQLAKIQTMKENNFVRDLAKNAGISRYLWTAVQKVCTNCTETVSGFQNWLPGEPRGVGKCVMMDLVNGQWRDFDCGYMFAFVCEKAMSETYTERQLLIALLVPIFSCLTVAISFTTALLVSSVRRVGQPFKVASRYGRAKRQRKPTNWDMVDTFRRVSLTRRGSRSKTRPPLPSIEIAKVEDTNGTIVANNESKRKVSPWYKRGEGKKTEHLHVQEERRGSSTSSGNSSLYELLLRLNSMDFKPQNETCITHNSIELKELDVHKNGVKPTLIDDGPSVSEVHKQLVKKRLKPDASMNGEANMAFRHSVVSVETNGSGVAKVTSVQHVNQRDSIGRLEDIQNAKSDTEHREVGQSSRDNPIESPCDRSGDENDREETEAGKNIQTVRADVHNITNYAGTTTTESIKKHEKKPSSKRKVVWTYSL